MADGIKSLPLAHRIKLHRDLIEYSILPSCACCEHNAVHDAKFNRQAPGTSQLLCTKFKSIPPIDVIVCGCPAWEQAVPF